MRILAVETASTACSCALLIDEEVAESYQDAPRRHAELLLEMVRTRLATAGIGLRDLDALAFGRGPGAFTGVRIAAAVVQGLALGADLGVVPVSTLHALAAGAAGDSASGRVLAAMDARMGEVYAGAFGVDDSGHLAALSDEQVCAPGELRLPAGEGWLGVGNGFSAHAEELQTLLGWRLAGTLPERLPRAADVARLALPAVHARALLAPEQAVPVYLRDRVATPPARR